MELMGIPHRVVISDRGLEAGTLEYKHRSTEEKEDISADSVLEVLKQRIKLG
jgi:prolyl-tRNA synthetase